jgi:hemerythrin
MHRRIPILGHALIDRQHARLDDLGRRLHAAVVAGRPAGPLLSMLLLQTRRHFASEERLMAIYGYPDLAGHVALHEGVINDMLRMRDILRSGLPVHRKYTMHFSDWLEHHATEADRNLAVFLASRQTRRDVSA